MKNENSLRDGNVHGPISKRKAVDDDNESQSDLDVEWAPVYSLMVQAAGLGKEEHANEFIPVKPACFSLYATRTIGLRTNFIY